MVQIVKKIVDNGLFKNFIIALIVVNGITMGMETSKSLSYEYGEFFRLFNIAVISIFTIEVILRIYVYRALFFKDPWSIFDFTIVTVSLIPAGGGFEVLRVLRILRLVSVVPQMRKIVTALISVIPGILSIAGFLSLFFYIFAIMSVKLFGENFPQWFGTLGGSFYTLFQIMTLESWSMGIVRPVMEVTPLAWIFFVPFIFLSTFIIVNLIIAIVVDAMNHMKEDSDENIAESIQQSENVSKLEIQKLRDDIKELKVLVELKLKKTSL